MKRSSKNQLLKTLIRNSESETVSIEGTLLTVDGVSLHVGVPIQVVSCQGDSLSRPIATTLSDERGRYQFINPRHRNRDCPIQPEVCRLADRR